METVNNIITASENHFITQKNDVEISERMIATKIALGKFDSADNYKEITAAEAEQLKAEMEEYFKALETENAPE